MQEHWRKLLSILLLFIFLAPFLLRILRPATGVPGALAPALSVAILVSLWAVMLPLVREYSRGLEILSLLVLIIGGWLIVLRALGQMEGELFTGLVGVILAFALIVSVRSMLATHESESPRILRPALTILTLVMTIPYFGYWIWHLGSGGFPWLPLALAGFVFYMGYFLIPVVRWEAIDLEYELRKVWLGGSR